LNQFEETPQPLGYGAPEPPEEKTLFGHPRGLYVLFSTELWERFSFYSMRGVMTLYMVQVVLAHMTAEKGADAAGGFADQVYGAYLGFVYSATFIGGMLADRLLGQRKAIYIGGILMSIAHFMLTTHAIMTNGADNPTELNYLFYLGLGLLACGNGFFKPNISTIVGTLYTPQDQRRDGAFTIFYMGINVGATAASFSSGVAQEWGWYLAYLLAGAGMIASLAILFLGRNWVGPRGLAPEGARLTGPGRFGIPNVVLLILGVLIYIPVASYLMSKPESVQNLTKWLIAPVLAYLIYEIVRGKGEERGRMIVIIVLCAFSMVFWGFFELQGSTIIRFADLDVSMQIFKWKVPSAWFGNFVNPFLIILLGIPFAWLWVWMDRKKIEPSTPLKFSLGLIQVAGGFLLLWVASKQADAGGKGSIILLTLTYLLFTTGELCLSPVGLSMITKLSPTRLVGVFMGLWFLAPAIGNVLTGGIVGRMVEAKGFTHTFMVITITIAASSVLLAILVVPLKRMMHGVK